MTAVSAAKTVCCAQHPDLKHPHARAPPEARIVKHTGLLGHCDQGLPLHSCGVTQVATGSDLQGGGLFSFIKAKGTPQNRAIIGSVFVALGVFFTNPQLVTV